MKIEVVYALPHKEGYYVSASVPPNSTAMQVLHYLELFSLYPEIDLMKNKLGIFGQQILPSHILAEGDRLEIYRPVYVDVKAARHQAAKRAK